MARQTKEEKTRKMWIVTGCIIALFVAFFGFGYAAGKTSATIDTYRILASLNNG